MKYPRSVIILLLFFVITLPLRAQVISTIASPGNKIYSVDGKIDVVPTIMNPGGVAVDDSGNVYVAEYWDATELMGSVFKFNPFDTSNAHGVITKGENIPRESGHISYPHGIATDHAGNMYVSEYSGHIALEITPKGNVTAIAGCGIPGYSGDNGNATLARLSLVNGIAIDRRGNIYIADEFNYAIRKVTPGGIISTFAGTGDAGYGGDGDIAADAQINRPYGIAIDDTGNVYFSDTYNNVIRKVDRKGIISTIAGNHKEGYSGDGGPATAARLNKPAGITIDNSGNLYVADEHNNVIRKITVSGIISTIAGNGREGYSGDGRQAVSAELSGPRDVAVDHKGNMYIADFGNHVIRKMMVPLPLTPLPLVKIPLLSALTLPVTIRRMAASQRSFNVVVFVTQSPVAKIPLSSAEMLPVTISPVAVTERPVIIPVFVVSTPLTTIPLLPAIAFPVTILPVAVTERPVTIPVFVALTPMAKIQTLSVTALSVTIQPVTVTERPVTIPVLVVSTPLNKIPMLTIVTLPVIISPVIVSTRTVTIPVFVVPTLLNKISLLPAKAVFITLPPVAASQQFVIVPDFVIALPPDIPSPPQNEEDKVTISITADNIMTIKSERGTYTSFTITSMSGVKMLEQAIKAKQANADVTSLPPGQYYINLKSDNETKTLRFVKEN